MGSLCHCYFSGELKFLIIKRFFKSFFLKINHFFPFLQPPPWVKPTSPCALDDGRSLLSSLPASTLALHTLIFHKHLDLSFSNIHHITSPPPPAPNSPVAPISLQKRETPHHAQHSVMLDSLGPMDCSLPGSSAHGIFQARILEWGAISYCRDLPDSGIQPMSPASLALASGFFNTTAIWEALTMLLSL